MLKHFLTATLLTLTTPAFAQEYILDNLPAGVSTDEVYFTGKWCNAVKGPFFGTRSVKSCGRKSPTDYYYYQPNLEAGTYDVYTRWVDREVFSQSVQIVVNYSTIYIDPFTGIEYPDYTSDSLVVNQSVGSNGWFYLGRFPNLGGENGIGIRVTGLIDSQANTDGARFVKVP